MRSLHGILLSLAVALAACSTAASTNGGATADDATAGDAVLNSDTTTDTAVGTDGVGDTAASTDIVDGNVGDATDGMDVSGKDATDAQTGGGDTVWTDLNAPDTFKADVIPTDSGPGPDVDTNACTAGCANIASAHCPQDPPVDACVNSCVEFQVQYAGTCSKELANYLKCVATAQVVCLSGQSDASVCSAESAAMDTCVSGVGNPNGCDTATCYGGAGPNGVTNCGCATKCNGGDVKLDCDGATCKCFYAGSKSAEFPQDKTCTSDVASLMQTACIPPP